MDSGVEAEAEAELEAGANEYRTVAMTKPRREARVKIDIFKDLPVSLFSTTTGISSLPFLTGSSVGQIGRNQCTP